MHDPIMHLSGIQTARIRSARLETQILTSGGAGGEPVLFLHGNLCSSTFWEATMLALPARFHAVAPDQRGYGLSDPTARIDARSGVADWARDAMALADTLGWDRLHVVGHSLGGCVAWRLIATHAQRLRSVTLFAPGPPCGFGGTHGMRGELNHPDGAGSGAGLVHPELVKRLASGERSNVDPTYSPRSVMNRMYWKPTFRSPREDAFLTAMLLVHLGPDRFPGDMVPSPHWPGFAPGRFGPLNALSPLYNQHVFEEVLAAREKPPLLWVHGKGDVVVSNTSLSDAGTQGQLGLRPGWPGNDVFPPQPLLAQITYAVDQYEKNGGRVTRIKLRGVGHTPFVERPAETHAALAEHLNESAKTR